MRLSIVIPVYNEAEWIARAVERVRAAPIEQEIIIVDDGSTDATPGVIDGLRADHPSIVLIRQEANRGKGSALRAGFAAATGDVVIVQDADLEYDPADYPRLLDPIERGLADVVFGSRFIGGEPHRVIYFWHALANRLLTAFSNVCTGLNLSDMTTGYKVFRADALSRITIEEDGFGVEPEITAKAARLGLRVYEVGVSYHGRTYAEGKKIRWRDAWIMLRAIVKYNWRA